MVKRIKVLAESDATAVGGHHPKSALAVSRHSGPFPPPFLRGGSSLESWLYRLGICKRRLNEPALQQRRRANFGLPGRER
jgi:hypothetical protein